MYFNEMTCSFLILAGETGEVVIVFFLVKTLYGFDFQIEDDT